MLYIITIIFYFHHHPVLVVVVINMVDPTWWACPRRTGPPSACQGPAWGRAGSPGAQICFYNTFTFYAWNWWNLFTFQIFCFMFSPDLGNACSYREGRWKISWNVVFSQFTDYHHQPFKHQYHHHHQNNLHHRHHLPGKHQKEMVSEDMRSGPCILQETLDNKIYKFQFQQQKFIILAIYQPCQPTLSTTTA